MQPYAAICSRGLMLLPHAASCTVHGPDVINFSICSSVPEHTGAPAAPPQPWQASAQGLVLNSLSKNQASPWIPQTPPNSLLQELPSSADLIQLIIAVLHSLPSLVLNSLSKSLHKAWRRSCLVLLWLAKNAASGRGWGNQLSRCVACATRWTIAHTLARKVTGKSIDPAVQVAVAVA